jgi:FtsZ-interacting cell division protein ZipA
MAWVFRLVLSVLLVADGSSNLMSLQRSEAALLLVMQIVVKLAKDGASWRDNLTVAAAVSSPVISLIVAGWVTWRTIRNDRTQRALDRAAERLQQVHDRQLTASADFADAAHKARIAVVRVDPAAGQTAEELAECEKAVDAGRLELARVQLLFRPQQVQVRQAAEDLIDALATAQLAAQTARKARTEMSSADEQCRRELLAEQGTAQAEYADAVRKAETSYEKFVTEAGAVLSAAA